MSELGYLRFGYRLYVPYSSSERFAKRIRRGYAADWAESFGKFYSMGSIPPPMFDDENCPLDFSCHPEMEKAYPVPWPVQRIQDLDDDDAPLPTPPEILARVPAPLAPVRAAERDDMDMDDVAVGGTKTGLPPMPPGLDLSLCYKALKARYQARDRQIGLHGGPPWSYQARDRPSRRMGQAKTVTAWRLGSRSAFTEGPCMISHRVFSAFQGDFTRLSLKNYHRNTCRFYRPLTGEAESLTHDLWIVLTF
ncbi:hypothetical protein DFP72DRAFT_861638 [Ephemerocybe angulata]|uniref:Uncharacterized protein n=1 Tax=Ephemerocybe angulata TaxID=980116 RepID=A0A8H6LS46_9AGAR|nr:hypothetical protein DFP72DRAFT_861638 [Tulosesus angulatus]